MVLHSGLLTAPVERTVVKSLRDWQDLINDHFVPLEVAPREPAEVGGTVRSRSIGQLQAGVLTSTPQVITRTKAQSGDGVARMCVALVDRGTVYLEQDGRQCLLADGAFGVFDTTRPYTVAYTNDFRVHVFMWPLAAVALGDADSQRISAVSIPRTTGIGALLSPMFVQATDPSVVMSPESSVRIASNMAELAITAGLEVARGSAEETGDSEVLHRVLAFIEERLDDPSLNADTVAREFFMSTRTLNRVFARRGLTVAAWIKSRRLEAARRALSSAATAEVPISQVALRFGFSSASFFSREFARQFGDSPRQYRKRRTGRP